MLGGIDGYLLLCDVRTNPSIDGLPLVSGSSALMLLDFSFDWLWILSFLTLILVHHPIALWPRR